MRDLFTSIINEVQRPGIKQLIDYLDTTDFFSAPASTSYHGCYRGGLVEHAIGVYKNIVLINDSFKLNIPKDSLIICALLHDLCKVNFYRENSRNRKNEQTGQWEKYNYYEIADQLPLGHGEKSVMIIQKYITLNDQELLAIRWHMCGFDDSVKTFGGLKTLSNALASCELLTALHMADLAESYFNKEIK